MAEVRAPDASVQFSSLAFLAEASAVLGTSLDYEATLARLAELAVPRLADWCVVHLADGAGILRAVTTAHLDPSRAAQLIDLQERYPVDFDDDGGPGSVLRTGTTLHLPEVSDEMLVRRARGGEHLELMRGLGIQSVVVVPLIARQRRLGILSLVTARGRSSTVDDVALAEELGRRAALAVDNARLFQDMERAQREARFQAALLRAQNEAGGSSWCRPAGRCSRSTGASPRSGACPMTSSPAAPTAPPSPGPWSRWSTPRGSSSGCARSTSTGASPSATRWP
ncbi:MAG: GAF domain-containing protein [Actinobacteria bacterium]|nr:GAF domain-containing protein [Actinomycetota bacterium]